MHATAIAKQPTTIEETTAAGVPTVAIAALQALRDIVKVAPGAPAGTPVGSTVFAIGTQFEVVPLRLVQTVPEPSVWWRLQHGDVSNQR